MSVASHQDFKTVCRHWRQFRKLSQLDLALAANVSQRHVSWLETGRSRPSREMVLRLSEAMEVPLRARNTLLQAAGFSAAYQESGLDEATMAPVLDALAARNILGGYDLSSAMPTLEGGLLVCGTETKTDADINAFVTAMGEIFGAQDRKSA